MHEQLSESLNPSQLTAYLDRLGLASDDTRPPSLEFLNELIYAHQTTIPFETLEIAYTGTDIKLDTQTLFNKIITNKRGGYCFELNSLFARLLETLGFELTYHLARAVIRRDYLDPYLHRINLAILDGQHYLVDVGFGGPCPASAIPLRIGEYIDSTGERFLLNSVWAAQQQNEQPASYSFDPDSYLWLLERATPDGHQKILLIDVTPCLEVDFITPNYYCASNPDSFFVQHRIANTRRHNGSANLTDNHIRVIENGQAIIDRDLNDDQEFEELLRHYFQLASPMPRPSAG